jgi:triosephosphate isomerase
MVRKPVALANWKMEMTLSESLDFLRRFKGLVGDLLPQVQVTLFPPYTALHAMARALGDSPIELGAQTISAGSGGAFTGEISARLVADAGGQWAQLGHWELRRHQGITDEVVNQKVHQALAAGLSIVLLIGEGRGETGPEEQMGAEQVEQSLDQQLSSVLAGCTGEQVRRIVFVYEPEWTIGIAKPAPPEHVQAGCLFIRQWLATHFSPGLSQEVRLAYGGSVSESYAQELLALPELDGLGAARKGRDPEAFASLVRLIVVARVTSG